MMNVQDYIELENRFGASIYFSSNVVLTRGNGVWVWDVTGKKYLDCIAGYSAANQGHCHPKIINALIDQCQKLSITSRSFRNDQLGLFFKEICELTLYEKAIPMNSGSEAVETAIKTGRKWGYKIRGIREDQAEIIVCENNYHGRTTTISGFSSRSHYKEGFGPFTPGFKTVPFGDARAVEDTITSNTTAFLAEPIQGEGGIVIPPSGYWQQVRTICDKHNILLILDEIQTGLGRTGKLLAQEHDGIKADITLIGKSLAGGFLPMSVILGDAKVMDVFSPGEHGSTFGGNPLACAVARKAIQVLVEEGMIENAEKMGAYFMSALQKITSPHIKEIRGKGLMIGIEVTSQSGGARKFCEKLEKKGLLCMETNETAIRLTPSLIIGKNEIDWAIEIIRSMFD